MLEEEQMPEIWARPTLVSAMTQCGQPAVWAARLEVIMRTATGDDHPSLATVEQMRRALPWTKAARTVSGGPKTS